ncbi:hypothetical protein BD414DRAFT_541114 [Trametes punicea]|nr:hypothetical protein BD414DRAFT_541114 [Trametes punicea]
MTVVPTALEFSTTPIDDLHTLASDDNFLYPRTPSGRYDYTQPFGCDALCDVIRAAFFTPKQYHNTGLRLTHKFTSLSPTAPHEKEIPAAMLALAASALEAVLTDHVNQMTSDFTVSMHGPYTEHLATAIDLFSKKPGPYHSLTHRIYQVVTSGQPQASQPSRSSKRGRARIDWDNIIG